METGEFCLGEAFRYAHEAAYIEVAGRIFGDRIMSIDIEPGWHPPSSPRTLAEVANFLHEPPLPERTLNELARAWQEAQHEVDVSGGRLPRSHIFTTTEIVGHVIFLAMCVEVMINRHLFYLCEMGSIDASAHKSLDGTEIITKILFAFKDEILSRALPISQLKYLVRLRNRAVHMKAGRTVHPRADELLAIWREVALLASHIDGAPSQAQIEALGSAWSARWIE